jgi:hypothetical protein
MLLGPIDAVLVSHHHHGDNLVRTNAAADMGHDGHDDESSTGARRHNGRAGAVGDHDARGSGQGADHGHGRSRYADRVSWLDPGESVVLSV